MLTLMLNDDYEAGKAGRIKTAWAGTVAPYREPIVEPNEIEISELHQPFKAGPKPKKQSPQSNTQLEPTNAN